eukprot:7326411-Pyramimonas_sp.AAC.1
MHIWGAPRRLIILTPPTPPFPSPPVSSSYPDSYTDGLTLRLSHAQTYSHTTLLILRPTHVHTYSYVYFLMLRLTHTHTYSYSGLLIV